MKVLVLGGSGYIGSHMVQRLAHKGCSVTILDDLFSGHHNAVQCVDFVQGNFGDCAVLEWVSKEDFICERIH